MPVWAAELARLQARLGVYAILGNHDWWYDLEGVRSALGGVRMPVHGKRRRAARATAAAASGSPGSATSSRIGSGRANSRASTICPARSAQVTTDDPVILLVHEPDIFTAGAGARGADARRPYPWRTDRAAVHAAAVDAVGIWRALRLRPHRRAGPPHDRVGRARLQQGAAAARRAAGDRARDAGRDLFSHSGRRVSAGPGIRSNSADSAPLARRRDGSNKNGARRRRFRSVRNSSVDARRSTRSAD